MHLPVLFMLIFLHFLAAEKRSKMESLMAKQQKVEEKHANSAERWKESTFNRAQALSGATLFFGMNAGYCKAPLERSENCSPYDASSFVNHRTMLSVQTNGRLGNQMSSLATAIALAKDSVDKWEVVLPERLLDGLSAHFPRVAQEVKAIEDLYCNPCEVPKTRMTQSKIESTALSDPKFSKGHYIVHEGYYQSLSRYRKYLSYLKDVFAFKTEIKETAQFKMFKAKENYAKSTQIDHDEVVVAVGIHVRRSDMLKMLKADLRSPAASKDYFDRARQHFVKKHGKNVLFLIVSDDPKWCFKYLVKDNPNTIFAGSLSEEKTQYVTHFEANGADDSAVEDLALLAASDGGLILSHGTFGLWGALLALADNPKLEIVAPETDEKLKNEVELSGVKEDRWIFLPV